MLTVNLDAGIDRWLDDNARRKGLVGIVEQLVALAQFVEQARQVAPGGLHEGKAASPLDGGLAAREAVLGKQHGEVAVLSGASRMHGLRHGAESLAYTGCLGCCVAQRPYQIVHWECAQLADRSRGAEHASGGGDVPAGIVVPGRHRIAYAGSYLEPKHESLQEIAPSNRRSAGIGTECRGDSARGVDVVFRQRVVEVVDMRADAVDERGMQRIKFLRAADQAGSRRAG